MAEDVQLWSPSAASNGTADPAINWAEGQARASVNNSARSMMAAHAKDLRLKNGSITTAGTANAQTILSGHSYSAVPSGLEVLVKVGPSLTSVKGTPVTINMDGIGAVGLLDQEGVAVEKGLVAGAYAHMLYNGTNWIFLDASVTNISNLTQITQVTIVNVSDGGTPVAMVDFTNLDTTEFYYYQIVGTDITLDTDNALLALSISTDNGVTFPFTDVTEYTSAEYWITEREYSEATPYPRSFSQFGQGFLWVSWYYDKSAPENFPITLDLKLYDFEPGVCPSFRWSSGNYHQSYWFTTKTEGNGHVITSTGCNAIRLWPTEGNFTGGSFTLYGVPR